MSFDIEDFRERWRHLEPAYPEVCGIPNREESVVCILPLDHEERHGWDNEPEYPGMSDEPGDLRRQFLREAL